uniref:(California timema) hypothetical protein n=1 Tax=Timema californicum TaxID=61474 RepID=A0A7R9J4U1_TIMCA|nr:unnamed protein product [Timema californicum]
MLCLAASMNQVWACWHGGPTRDAERKCTRSNASTRTRNCMVRGAQSSIEKQALVHPTEIRTSISPPSAAELNTTSALANYAIKAG